MISSSQDPYLITHKIPFSKKGHSHSPGPRDEDVDKSFWGPPLVPLEPRGDPSPLPPAMPVCMLSLSPSHLRPPLALGQPCSPCPHLSSLCSDVSLLAKTAPPPCLRSVASPPCSLLCFPSQHLVPLTRIIALICFRFLSPPGERTSMKAGTSSVLFVVYPQCLKQPLAHP